MRDLYNGSNRTTPTIVDVRAVFDWCPVIYIGTNGPADTDETDCSAHAEYSPPSFSLTQPSLIFPNTTFLKPPDASLFNTDDYRIPLNNLIYSLHAAARTDLGSFRPNNLFTNASMLQSIIKGRMPGGSIHNATDLKFAGALLGTRNLSSGTFNLAFTALPLAPAGPSVILNYYLCHFKIPKSTAALVFGMFVATMSLFSTAWTVFMIFADTWIKRRSGGRFTVMKCACEASSYVLIKLCLSLIR